MYEPASFIAVSITLTLLGLVAILLRAYVRTKLCPGNLGFDDLFVVIAWFLVSGTTVLTIIGTVNGGLGRHSHQADGGGPLLDDRTILTLKVIYAQDIVEKLGFGCIKLSFLFFYRRIFVTGASAITKIFTDVMIALVVLWALSLFIVEILVCGAHPEVLWAYQNAAERSSSCVNTSAVLLVFAVTDVLGDLLIIGLPLQCVWRLNKSRKDKIGLGLIFSLGLISTIAGVVRLVFVVEAFEHKFGQAGDVLGSISPPFMWTIIESAIGVIAACLPALAPLVTRRKSQGSIPLQNHNAAASHGQRSASNGNRGVEDQPGSDRVGATPHEGTRQDSSTFPTLPSHPGLSGYSGSSSAREAGSPRLPSRQMEDILIDFGWERDTSPLTGQQSRPPPTPSMSFTDMSMEGP